MQFVQVSGPPAGSTRSTSSSTRGDPAVGDGHRNVHDDSLLTSPALGPRGGRVRFGERRLPERAHVLGDAQRYAAYAVKRFAAMLHKHDWVRARWRWSQRSYTRSDLGGGVGGADRIRTGDLLVAKAPTRAFTMTLSVSSRLESWLRVRRVASRPFARQKTLDRILDIVAYPCKYPITAAQRTDLLAVTSGSSVHSTSSTAVQHSVGTTVRRRPLAKKLHYPIQSIESRLQTFSPQKPSRKHGPSKPTIVRIFGRRAHRTRGLSLVIPENERSLRSSASRPARRLRPRQH